MSKGQVVYLLICCSICDFAKEPDQLHILFKNNPFLKGISIAQLNSFFFICVAQSTGLRHIVTDAQSNIHYTLCIVLMHTAVLVYLCLLSKAKFPTII